MQENRILSAAIKSRKAWELLNEHVSGAEVSSDTSAILSLIQDYYSRDGSAQTVDLELLIPAISRQFPNPKHVTALTNVLRNLPETSPDNVASEILEIKRHNAGLKLSSALIQGSSDLKQLYEEYGSLLAVQTLDPSSLVEEEIVENWQVKDLVEKAFDPKELIPLWPEALNLHLEGGCRPGHHVLVFAPTEMGKTLLLINMLAGWVKAKLRTLYVGNEDPVEDLQMRYISRLTQMKKSEILAHPAEAQRRMEKKGYEHVIFAPLAPGNFTSIDRLVRKYEPKVLVLDQLRNLDVDSDNRTQALEKAATGARNLAKRHQLLVVSVSQASDSATGKRILSRGDVDGSNVGIPGQTDLMIGLGATDEDEKMNVRTLSFPKNKISGDHGTVVITIDPQLSMVVERGI